MRKFVITRGAPGCGKSTLIREKGLDTHTVSSDSIRLLVASTHMNPDGTIGISQKEDKWVWEKIYEILEIRFKHGLFTVFDATNTRTADLNALKQLANKYNYEVYCVDFSDIPIETVKERNKNREAYRQVPEVVIDRMYERLKNNAIPFGITVVKPENFDSIFFTATDVSEYNAIHFIGDIHGCYDALMKTIDNGIKDDEMYVFCGDYVDRGIQNAEVVKFLISIMDKKNVILLEGNHERHLRDWVNDNKIVSDVFRNETKNELEIAGISTKKVKRLCDVLKDCAYITYHNKTIFACHGGIARIPDRLDLLASEQMIRGVGRYTDCEDVETVFERESKDIIMVHGHRNITHETIHPHENVYNLENAVEFGGTLRMVSFYANDIKTTEIVNTTFKKEHIMSESEVEKVVGELRENPYVIEKKFGNVSSFNFSRKAFDKKVWNDQTIKARGLYIDTVDNKIVARSYNKFFRIDENEDVTMNALKSKISLPVSIYKKENGFLGIFSSYNGEPFFATKSSIDGTYNEYFKSLMYSLYGEDKINEMNYHCNKHNCTMVFEVIDIEHDPHIIEYEKSDIILLDIIRNNMRFEKMNYKELCEAAQQIGLKVKERIAIFHTYKDFEKFINRIKNTNDLTDINEIEGYVIEDYRSFMVKCKTPFYDFWKWMRGIVASVMKYGKIKDESILENEMAQNFYEWIVAKYNDGVRYESDKIITIRTQFFAEKGVRN